MLEKYFPLEYLYFLSLYMYKMKNVLIYLFMERKILKLYYFIQNKLLFLFWQIFLCSNKTFYPFIGVTLWP